MKKVMVFNFQTMQYEQVSEAEGKEWVGLIESMNADCAAQHSVQRIGFLRADQECPHCHGIGWHLPTCQSAHRK